VSNVFNNFILLEFPEWYWLTTFYICARWKTDNRVDEHWIDSDTQFNKRPSSKAFHRKKILDNELWSHRTCRRKWFECFLFNYMSSSVLQRAFSCFTRFSPLYSLFPVWLTFSSLTHFFQFDSLFPVWLTFSSLTHFFRF